MSYSIANDVDLITPFNAHRSGNWLVKWKRKGGPHSQSCVHISAGFSSAQEKK